MRYVMSLDGGGTKLSCLIADENGKLAGIGKGGPTNPNYVSRTDIEEAIKASIFDALASGGINRDDICLVNLTLITNQNWETDYIKGLLNDSVTVQFHNEMIVSLYGAIQEDYGGLVLSGTGSFAIARTENDWVCVGGWGDILGDEGSGYYIGYKALKACTQMADGVIPHSMLIDRVMEAFNLKNLGEMVWKLKNAPLGQQRVMIASVCPIAGWCADRGDQVAIGIFRKAAVHLARQMRTAAVRCGKEDITVTVSGGAWKASHVFFSSFREELKKELPLATVKPPLFEPVVGGILLGLRDLGFNVKENIGLFKKNFAAFAYDEGLFVM